MISAAIFFATVAPAGAADRADEADQEQSLLAQRWMEAFKRLDATNNITIVISNRDSLYELEYVTEFEASARIIVVRCVPPDGRTYRALVHPGSILLIRETPPGAKPKTK